MDDFWSRTLEGLPFTPTGELWIRVWTLVAVAVAVAVISARGEVAPEFFSRVEDWLFSDRVSWWEREEPVKRRKVAMSVPDRCSSCRKPSAKLQRCGRCKGVSYCSVKCQQAHWRNGHRQACKPSATPAACAQPPAVPEQEEHPTPTQIIYPYNDFLDMFHFKDPLWAGRVPVGLVNCGNSCFANAVFQCLLATRPLVAFFEREHHRQRCSRHRTSDWCLLCELDALFEQARSACKPIGTVKIMKRVSRIGKEMTFRRQEDAHEFLIKLLDTMEGIFYAEMGGKQQYDLRSQETTFSHHLFSSYARNCTTCCECGFESKSFQSDIGLSLELPPGVASVDDGLARYFADETLDVDNQWKCGKCKRPVQATKSFRLETAPNVLIITLKRFMLGRFGKISRRVAYAEALDLGPYVVDTSPDDAPATYSLFGVLVHLSHNNATTFGHCVSYVRNEEGAWHLCDDASVHPVSPQTALSQPAYVLFYIRDVPRTGPSTLCPPYSSTVDAPSSARALDLGDDGLPPVAEESVSPRSLHVVSGGASSEGASDDAGAPSPSYRTCFSGDQSRWTVRVDLAGTQAEDVELLEGGDGIEVAAKGWAPLCIPYQDGFERRPFRCRFVRRTERLVARFARAQALDCCVGSAFDLLD